MRAQICSYFSDSITTLVFLASSFFPIKFAMDLGTQINRETGNTGSFPDSCVDSSAIFKRGLSCGEANSTSNHPLPNNVFGNATHDFEDSENHTIDKKEEDGGDFPQLNFAAKLCWEEKRKHHQFSSAEDPLIESVYGLQAAQEALEQEIRKFELIGNKPLSPDDDSTKCSGATTEISATDLEFFKPCISSQSGVEGQIPSSALEHKVLSLRENVNISESKSEELHGMLALKDSRIAELEAALSAGKFLKEESASTIGLSVEKIKEVESELESLLRQKIEAEVEYLTFTGMIQNLKFASAFTLIGKQEKLSGTEEADSKDSMRKNKEDELEKYCGYILGIEDTFMIQKCIFKLTFCLFIQFTLLFLVFWFFLSQLSPTSGLVVPT